MQPVVLHRRVRQRLKDVWPSQKLAREVRMAYGALAGQQTVGCVQDVLVLATAYVCSPCASVRSPCPVWR